MTRLTRIANRAHPHGPAGNSTSRQSEDSSSAGRRFDGRQSEYEPFDDGESVQGGSLDVQLRKFSFETQDEDVNGGEGASEVAESIVPHETAKRWRALRAFGFGSELLQHTRFEHLCPARAELSPCEAFDEPLRPSLVLPAQLELCQRMADFVAVEPGNHGEIHVVFAGQGCEPSQGERLVDVVVVASRFGGPPQHGGFHVDDQRARGAGAPRERTQLIFESPSGEMVFRIRARAGRRDPQIEEGCRHVSESHADLMRRLRWSIEDRDQSPPGWHVRVNGVRALRRSPPYLEARVGAAEFSTDELQHTIEVLPAHGEPLQHSSTALIMLCWR